MPNDQTPVGSIAPQTANPNTAFQTAQPASTGASSAIDVTGMQTQSNPVNFQSPQETPPFDVSNLGTQTPNQTSAYDQNTQPQQQASDLTKQIESLNQSLSGKAAFQTQQYQQQGFGTTTDAQGNLVAVDPGMQDLQTQLNTLSNQAKAIPLQNQLNATGRGITAGGLAPMDTGALRNNAIQALNVQTLISARNGALGHAQMLVDIATQQKFGPQEQQLKADQANLQLIQNSPEYTNAEKKQAAQQAQIVAQQSAQLDLAKTNYANAQNAVVEYAPVASAQQLQEMQKAQSPAEVATIANKYGLQTPAQKAAAEALATSQANIAKTQAETGLGRYKDTIMNFRNIDGTTTPVPAILDTKTGQITRAQGGQSAATMNGGGSGTSSTGGNAPGTTGKAEIDTTTPGYTTTALANAGGLTQAALDQKALSYITSGTQPPVGRTGLAGLQMRAISARMGEMAPGGNLAGNKAELKSYTDSLATQQKYLDSTQRAFNTANQNLTVLTGFMKSANINTASGIPLINSLENSAKAGLLDPGAVAGYRAAIAGLRAEYAQVLSRGGEVTEGQRAQANSLIPDNLSPAQLQQVTDRLKAEGTNAVGEAQGQVQKIQGQINGILKPPSSSGTSGTFDATSARSKYNY